MLFFDTEMWTVGPATYNCIFLFCNSRIAEVCCGLFVSGCSYGTSHWSYFVTMDWIWWPQAPFRNVAYVKWDLFSRKRDWHVKYGCFKWGSGDKTDSECNSWSYQGYWQVDLWIIWASFCNCSIKEWWQMVHWPFFCVGTPSVMNIVLYGLWCY